MEKNELFGIEAGVICQQCNCKGAYGAGLSGAISEKYPVVLSLFEENYEKNRGKQFGTYQVIPVAFNNRIDISEEFKRDKNTGVGAILVANIYSQDGYGNSAKTGIQYTNTDKLVAAIKDIAKNYKDRYNVYIPHSVDKAGNHNGIGCGLAGEKWENLYPRLQALNMPNLYLLDTFTGEREKVVSAKTQTKVKKQADIER